jgi:hypothetical protein
MVHGFGQCMEFRGHSKPCNGLGQCARKSWEALSQTFINMIDAQATRLYRRLTVLYWRLSFSQFAQLFL